MERMGMRRRALMLVATLGLLVGSWVVAPAEAGADFCAGDPILRIGQETVRIVVSIPTNRVQLVTQATPVELEVFVPDGIDAQVMGWSGPFFERVTFTRSKDDVSGGTYALKYRVKTPVGGAGTAYKGYHTAFSSVETKQTDFDGGKWDDNSVKVPTAKVAKNAAPSAVVGWTFTSWGATYQPTQPTPR